MEELPNEIVADIVSRLKTTEAARTCSLVLGWRNLWTESRNLDLDFKNQNYNGDHARKCVDQVLTKLLHHQGDMDNMRIAFHDDNNLDRSFMEWIEFANFKRVQSLTIDLNPLKNLSKEPQIQSILKWDRLTELSLKSVAINNSDVRQLLSKTPNLETLFLENLHVTKLELQHAKLKRLEIQDCVQILECKSAPNLECLKHVPMKMHQSVIIDFDELDEGLPRLRAVFLGGPICIHELEVFAEKAPALEKLQLEMDRYCEHEDNCWEECERNIIIPRFKNVKQLELRFTATQEHEDDDNQMSTVRKIVDACSSSLEKLTFMYEIQKHGDEDEVEGVDDYPVTGANDCLRDVRVVGWSGLRSEVRLVRYLIHTCPNIQGLLLDSTPPSKLETSWSGEYSHVAKSEAELESAARVAQKLIHYLHMYNQDL